MKTGFTTFFILSLFLPLLFLNQVRAAVYKENQRFNYKNITVCFHVNSYNIRVNQDINNDLSKGLYSALPLTNLQRKLIKTVINEEYTLKSTGAYFTGWQNCRNGKVSDVVLFQLSSRPNTKYVNHDGFYISKPKILSILFLV